MEVGRRKRITWESRIKSDELNGGLKIFHGEEENSEESRPETQTGFQRISQTHNKLQSLADLVMWRDVSKSAFMFGIGTFIIIASSYTKDINISFITAVSYLGLVYLAAIFLFKSIICRGVIGGDDTNQDYIVGEEEAVWLVKMILPYLNEFLLKFRTLFCGDPATTMKLAIMLFVLARFGSTITIWKMAKLGFFGVFSLPKICSSYSSDPGVLITRETRQRERESYKEMELGRRKRTTRNGVVAGSVWESRMKSDEVKGGIKVFNGEEENSKLVSNKSLDGPSKNLDGLSDGTGRNSFELKVAKPESNEAFVESVVAIEKSPVGIVETSSDETRERERESYKEMEVGRRKRITWESRIKSDELNGGLKIFYGEEENSEESGDKSLRPKPSPIGVSGKRKTWKSENSDGLGRSPIQIARQRSEINKNLDVQCKESSVSTNGIKKNPVQSKKSRSEQLSVSVNGIERSPIHKMKTRSKESKELNVFVERTERKLNQVRKANSESQKLVGESDDGNERNLVQLRKVKPESNKALDESVDTKAKLVSNKSSDGPSKNLDGLGDGTGRNSFELKVAKPESNEAFVEFVVAIEKSPVGIAETRSDETREREREGYKEMEVGRRKRITWESRIKSDELNGGLKIFHGEEENSEESGDKSLRPKPSPIGVSGKRKTWKSENSDGLERSPIQIARQRSEINKNLDVQCKKSSVSTDGIKKNLVQSKKSRSEQLSVFVNGIERSPFHKMKTRSEESKELNVFVERTERNPNQARKAKSESQKLVGESDDGNERNLVQLSKVKSGSTKALDESVDTKAKLVSNKSLDGPNKNLDGLSDGTGGNSFELKVAKLILKFESMSKFWIGQLRDVWESCSHKKAVAFGIFALVWNLSSVVARIWAVFMLFVAFRCYQQSLVRDDWVEDEAKCETTCQVQIGGQRQRRRPTLVELKERK
ncbi:unnamed protein product [Camellia sinensis]